MASRLALSAFALLAACGTARSDVAAQTIDTSQPGVITMRRPGPADGRWSGAHFTYTARIVGMTPEPGVALVVRVDTPSPADSAGIVVGDTVVAVNGQLVTRFPMLSAPPGTKLTYRLRRNGVERDVSVVVGRRLAPADDTRRP